MSDVGRIKGGILLTNLMPAIFIGHGNPMNALSENNYTEGWASIGKSIPRPRAILSVSAHYYIPFIYVLGLRKEMEKVSFPVQGVDGGSVSMLAVKIG
ncbi:MAG: hypothetical protein PVJ20_05010 [Desulfobacterales bacterium]|jgi:aromatic ring-opening dioxygenase catalytic subunit (LigB family)